MRYFFLTVLIFNISCISSTNAPDNLIPKEKMVDILVDIHIADGMFTSHKIRQDYILSDSINYYDKIFEHYGYNRKDFDTSVYYYSHNINEYNKIYIEVLNRLSEMEAKVKEEEQLLQQQDTIQKPE